MLEDVFLYAVFRERQRRLLALRKSYKLGDSSEQNAAAHALLIAKGISLSDADRLRLARKLMETQIKALEDPYVRDGSEAVIAIFAVQCRLRATSCHGDPRPPEGTGQFNKRLSE